MPFKFTNPIVTRALNETYRNEAFATNFEERCGAFIEILNSQPKETELKIMPTKEWALLVKTDHKKANEIVRNELNQRISLLWIVSSFKINKLFNSTLELINAGNLYPALVLVRALTEVSCNCSYTLSRAIPLIREANCNTSNYAKYHSACHKLEKELMLGISASKITALTELPNTTTAQSILNAIDDVSKKEKYSTIRKQYDNLCEFVHPNKQSTDFFGIPTILDPNSSKQLKDEKLREELRKKKIRVRYGRIEKYILNAPDYFESAESYLGMLISVISMNIALFVETLLEFRGAEVQLLIAGPTTQT
ncbi:MAG: hypothetical protein WC792_05220 [Candidatus Micrarchaeia archaeon]|jgi:hypothetical protein